ncbi:hypothetical protein [Adhaeribacter pallidiroseus]|uniref:Uncharacterized protein n=1 Tax=Adhaeribacter pallidiroseus TaxID=2072847 RepID=A0A369QL27_9BACT|nr:hypothetical protein [Adhaeribacter pallidiroseus]RDC65082.1 hypothetical protein AHMF7616_03705 [Adhaeribacter pallidiroseus]
MLASRLPNEPLLILSPISQNYVNILPFFKLLDKENVRSPVDYAENVEAVIRFVSLNYDAQAASSVELKNALSFLFDMKDMFINSCEIKSI